MPYPFREGQWAGQPAFVIGGGPSLKDFDWDLLNPYPNIVCVNMAYKDIPHAAAMFTEDVRVIELAVHRDDWKQFKGWKILHVLSQRHQDTAKALDPSIILIQKQKGTKHWARDFSGGLSYSSNSMIGALNFVDIMDAEPIYILGLDCHKVGKKTGNYHDCYPENWKTFDQQYVNFKNDFENWAALHLKRRIVINLNPDSAVEAWPRLDPREVLGDGLAMSPFEAGQA